MAAHVWTSGESITASKLNAIERKRAWVNGTLPLETLTWNEAIALFEDVGEFKYRIESDYIITSTQYDTNGVTIYYEAASADSLLQKKETLPK